MCAKIARSQLADAGKGCSRPSHNREKNEGPYANSARPPRPSCGGMVTKWLTGRMGLAARQGGDGLKLGRWKTPDDGSGTVKRH